MPPPRPATLRRPATPRPPARSRWPASAPMSAPSAPPRAPRTRRDASRQPPTRPSTRPTARRRSPRGRSARSTAACGSSARRCGRSAGTEPGWRSTLQRGDHLGPAAGIFRPRSRLGRSAACRLHRSSTRCIRSTTRSRPSRAPPHPERSRYSWTQRPRMAVAVSPMPDASPLTAPERALARWLRLFAVLFALGTLGFLLRPDDTVRNLDRVGSLLGLPTLPPSHAPVASDFWLALAVADVRGRRALVYPVVVSKLASSGTALLLFVQWTHALPLLAIALVDLPIAVILLRALSRARPST